MRGAMAFTSLRLDLVLTPLAASQLEALQAIKAAEMVRQFGKRAGRQTLHRCLLTRVPAALKPRSLTTVIGQLRVEGVEILPTALVEKEAFRSIFAHGGGLSELERRSVYGAVAARYVQAYVAAVTELL